MKVKRTVMHVQSDFIGEYQVNDSAVSELVHFWEQNKDNADMGRIGFGYDENRKKSKELLITPDNLPEFTYYHELFYCLNHYIQEYQFANEVNKFSIFENTKVQYYDKGWGYYDYHCENEGYKSTRKRHLVFMTYLNDVKDGGTEFFYQQRTTNAERGKTVIWPSAWTHTHRGCVSEEQEKLIVTGWFSFDD